MKSYADWSRAPIEENNFFRDAARGVSNFNRSIKGENPIDYNAIDQQAQAAKQAAAQRDDPAVKQAKYNSFKKALVANFFKWVPLKGPHRNRAEQAIDNLAKSYTMGYKIHARDLDELLLAIHTSQDVDEHMKAHTFADHYRLLMFVQQAYDHDPSVWYNPDARNKDERYPPGAVLNDAEINHYLDHWRKSPFRFKHQPPAPPTPPPGSPGHAAGAIPPLSNSQEFMDWMVKTFLVTNARQKGKTMIPFAAINLQLHEWKALAEILAKQAGITLTPQDYDRLKELA